MDRAARKQGQVERSLAEAALLADQARRDGNLAKWAAAVAATRQAAGFLDGADGGEADDGTRRQVRRTLADLEREEGLARSRSDQAARDRQLLADLEDEASTPRRPARSPRPGRPRRTC